MTPPSTSRLGTFISTESCATGTASGFAPLTAGAPMLTFLDIKDIKGVTARLRVALAPLTPLFGTSSGGERRT